MHKDFTDKLIRPLLLVYQITANRRQTYKYLSIKMIFTLDSLFSRSVYPDKYCSLIRSEGGEELLRRVVVDERPYERVKQLARIVLDNVDAVDERMRRMRHEDGDFAAAVGAVNHGPNNGEEEEDMDTDDEQNGQNDDDNDDGDQD